MNHVPQTWDEALDDLDKVVIKAHAKAFDAAQRRFEQASADWADAIERCVMDKRRAHIVYSYDAQDNARLNDALEAEAWEAFMAARDARDEASDRLNGWTS
jgi:hypothetical protein